MDSPGALLKFKTPIANKHEFMPSVGGVTSQLWVTCFKVHASHADDLINMIRDHHEGSQIKKDVSQDSMFAENSLENGEHE